MIARIKITSNRERNWYDLKWEWVYYGSVYSDRYPEGRIVWWGDWNDTLIHCCDYLEDERLRNKALDQAPKRVRQSDLFKA